MSYQKENIVIHSEGGGGGVVADDVQMEEFLYNYNNYGSSNHHQKCRRVTLLVITVVALLSMAGFVQTQKQNQANSNVAVVDSSVVGGLWGSSHKKKKPVLDPVIADDDDDDSSSKDDEKEKDTPVPLKGSSHKKKEKQHHAKKKHHHHHPDDDSDEDEDDSSKDDDDEEEVEKEIPPLEAPSDKTKQKEHHPKKKHHDDDDDSEDDSSKDDEEEEDMPAPLKGSSRKKKEKQHHPKKKHHHHHPDDDSDDDYDDSSKDDDDDEEEVEKDIPPLPSRMKIEKQHHPKKKHHHDDSEDEDDSSKDEEEQNDMPPLEGSSLKKKQKEHHHHKKKHHPVADEDSDDSSSKEAVDMPLLKASPNTLQLEGFPPLSVQQEYLDALVKVDWDAVQADIEDLLTDSQDWWPADYGTYGGLFVRLSWHSCGSYRASDGRGGCDGGGQRFDPERSWPDNTNLDKARRLLQPIKEKYGLGVSWGDLFALTGTVAIRAMGGPKIGFCAGRLDFQDNAQTRALGPTPEQDKFAHCPVNGQCPFPLGQNTLGLIYVNPAGPMGEPDLQGAADTIRDVFGRMDWEGRELVALIGGGHTFGKAHGATKNSPGKLPSECPFAPWAGATGMDAVTSGFEGPWTSHPDKWDNHYFQYLVDYEWEPWKGPGGNWQWRVKGGDDDGPVAPAADPASVATQPVMMLTTDVALVADDEYRVYVQEFAKNQTALAHAFKHAWYKLVTRDMGPYERCVGPKAEKAHGFQHALPPPPKDLADMKDVAKDLKKLMKKEDGEEGEFLRLAWQCASTYRATDYQGGCNGARIRFAPGKDWPTNAGLETTLAKLEPIKQKYGEGLSYADLIVLAGNVAAELRGAPEMDFCPGRTDAVDGKGWNHLAYGNEEYPTSVDAMMELCQRRGQTTQEFVALLFGHYDSTDKLKADLDSPELGGVLEQGLKYNPDLRYWADYYVAAGDAEFKADFAKAWTKLMNADRFDGPLGNVCG